MTRCLFASDLHGHLDQYEKLFALIEEKRPDAVFLGGDLLPSALAVLGNASPEYEDFVSGFLAVRMEQLRHRLASDYPEVFIILGNDDSRGAEQEIRECAESGLWQYVHDTKAPIDDHYTVYGYSFVPPTPFPCKDWERYDVSRYVPPGSTAPEEGWRSEPVADHVIRHATIREDLVKLAGSDPMDHTVFLFHSPPHETKLDRAGLDGKMVDHVPLDLHVGSIAIRRFIEDRQPLLTLHGHIHESTRLTGSWRDRIGRTHMFNAAHEGPELAVVSFDLRDLADATYDLL